MYGCETAWVVLVIFYGVLGREVVPLGPPQAQPCQVVSPADSGGGARLSPEKAGGKSAGGCAPWTPGFL